MQTTSSSPVRLKRKRSSRTINSHPSLGWYWLVFIATMGSHSQHHGIPSANAILNPYSSNPKLGYSKTRSILLEHLRGGGDDETKDDKNNVLDMDDTELDAYIEFLLAEEESSKEKKNPFQPPPRQEQVVAQVQEEPIDDDDNGDSSIDLVSETDQRGEETTGPIHSENAQEEIDARITETAEPSTMGETATFVAPIEVEPIHSENVQDETDASTTIDLVKTELVEETHTAAESSMEEEEEISDLSTIESSMEEEKEEISESLTISEQDEADDLSSSDVAEDEITSTFQPENDDLNQVATVQESFDAQGNEVEIDLTQEIVITTGRSSLWGKLFKSLVRFEQDDSTDAQDEGVKETRNEETPAEAISEDVAAAAESSEEIAEPSPSLRERCHAQWQKLKASIGIKSSGQEVDPTFVGREPQRDYTKIYKKYYAVDESNKSESVESCSETEKSTKAASSWFAFFSKTSQKRNDANSADDSETESSDLLIEADEEDIDVAEITAPKSDDISIGEVETTESKRQVLSLDRIEDVSKDEMDDMSSDETLGQFDEDQPPALSLEIPTESARDSNEEASDKEVSSEQDLDSVVLSLEIPVVDDVEDGDEAPILQDEAEAEGLRDSTVLSLDIPVAESIKEEEDGDSQCHDDVERYDSRVVLSLDVPSVEQPKEDDAIVLSDVGHHTVVLSLDIPVVTIAEEGQADFSVEVEDDTRPAKVSRLALSMDQPTSTVEIVDEASDQRIDETLMSEDESDYSDETISTDPDTTALLDIDELNENFDLDESEEDVPTEEVEDDESLDDILQELDALDDDEAEAVADKLLQKPEIQKELGIVDRCLFALFVLLVFLEEMLKTYILPPIEELVDWGLYKKPPPLFREDFSLRKFLAPRGGAAKPTSFGSAKVHSENETEDDPKEEEIGEGSDPEAEKRATETETNQNEAAPSPTHQSMAVTKVRPNLIYRYLLGYGLVGHSIIMASIFSVEWIETYLPALTFFAVYVKRQLLGTTEELRDVEESFASQTTGFVDGTGSTVRGGKKKKAQTQKDDQQALDQLNRLGDASQARYYFVSNAFLKRHSIGPYSLGTSEIATEAEAFDVDQDEEESDEDWVFEALTRKEASTGKSTTEPSVDVSISSSGSSLSVGVDFGFGESKKSRRGASISKVALSSASTRTAKSRKPAGQRVSDRESGVVGRIRAVGANSFVGRSILGAYPGDVPPPDEAADPKGLLGLASKYGYGDWSDVEWSDADDTEFVRPKRKTRRKRKSVSGSERKPKETLVGLGLDELVRDTQSSRTRRTRSAASRPKPHYEGVSTASKSTRKTRIRRKKKLPSTSISKKVCEQKDAVKSTRGSSVLKANRKTTSGSTVTGPAIESMKESVKLEESVNPKPDISSSSESITMAGEANSSTATALSRALKKYTAQKDAVKSSRESNVLNPAIGSAVTGSAILSLKENVKSKGETSSFSTSTPVTGLGLSSLKKSEDSKELGTFQASSSATGFASGSSKESRTPATELALSSLKKNEDTNKTGTSKGTSSVAGPAIGSIKENGTKARSGVANSALDALKKKAKEKSKSSILDPKVQKAQSDDTTIGNQDTK